MINLILFLVGSVGMTHIIIDGSIFDKPRRFLKNNLPEYLHNLFECYMCCGFWCGVIMGSLIITDKIPLIFACGCTASALSHLHATVLNTLESISIKYTNNT